MVVTIYLGSALPMVVIFEVSGILAFCWEKFTIAIFEAEGINESAEGGGVFSIIIFSTVNG